MANSLVKTKKKFSVAIQEDKYKALINNTLGNPKKAERFIAAISSAVAINPALQECDANSIILMIQRTVKLRSSNSDIKVIFSLPFVRAIMKGLM